MSAPSSGTPSPERVKAGEGAARLRASAGAGGSDAPPILDSAERAAAISKSHAKTPPLQGRRWDLARTTSTPVMGTTTPSPIPGTASAGTSSVEGSPSPPPSVSGTSPAARRRPVSGMFTMPEDEVLSIVSDPAVSPGPGPSADFIVPFSTATSPPPSGPSSGSSSGQHTSHPPSGLRLSTTPLFPSPLAQAMLRGDGEEDDGNGMEGLELEEALAEEEETEDDDSPQDMAPRPPGSDIPPFDSEEGDETLMPPSSSSSAEHSPQDKGKRPQRDAGGLKVNLANLGSKEKLRMGSPLRRIAAIETSPEAREASSPLTPLTASPVDIHSPPSALGLHSLQHPPLPASLPTPAHRRRSIQQGPRNVGAPVEYTAASSPSASSPLSPFPQSAMSEPPSSAGTVVPRQISPLGFRKPPDFERSRIPSGGSRASMSGSAMASSAPIPLSINTGPATTGPSSVSGSGSHSRQTSLSSASGSGTSRRNSLIFGASPIRTTNRSALSAALATNASTAPPAAPLESIKIQRVPTSVRIAQEIRPSMSQPSSPVAGFAGGGRSLPSFEAPLPPPTPMATRAGSPADSGSDSSKGQRSRPGTDAGWSGVLSQNWDAASPSGSGSLASPITFSSSLPGAGGAPQPGTSTADSAFSPVFPFVSASGGSPQVAKHRRDRSRSNFSAASLGSAEASTWGRPPGDDLSVSPHSSATGASSLHPSLPSHLGSGLHASTSLRAPSNRAVSVGNPPPGLSNRPSDELHRRLSTSVNERRALQQHRTSVAPGSGPSTEDFARIITQSRTAKLNKWGRPGSSEGSGAQTPMPGWGKPTSTGSLGVAEGLRTRPTGLGGPPDRRMGIPDFSSLGPLPATPKDEAGPPSLLAISHAHGAASETDLDHSDIGSSERGTAAYSTAEPSKEIEWVDWLDDYKKMKDAKLKIEETLEKRRSMMAEASVGSGSHADLSRSDVEDEEDKDELRTPMHPATARTTRAGSTSATPQARDPISSSVPSSGPYHHPAEYQSSSLLPPLPDLPLEPTVSMPLDRSFYGSEASGRQRRLSVSSLIGNRGRVDSQSHSSSAGRMSHTELLPTDTIRRSAISPSGKRKKNFNLGRKIDEWWTAVKSSFNPDEPRTPSVSSVRSSGKAPQTPVEAQAPPKLAAPPEERQSKLRNATSALELQRSRSPPAFGGKTPTGPLAPAARIAPARLGPPPRSATSQSGSSQGSEEQTSRPDSRRRNPNLTIKLDPLSPTDFSDVFRGFGGGRGGSSARRSSSSVPDQAKAQPERPKPKTAGSDPMQARAAHLGLVPRSEATPSLEPGHRLWDQTPGLMFGDPFRPTAPSPAQVVSAPPPPPTEDQSPHDPAFSLHTIHQHIRTRLATAKASCDKELKGIVREITSYVEAEAQNLREQERLAQEAADDEEARESEVLDTEPETESEAAGPPVTIKSPLRRPLSRTLSVPADAIRTKEALRAGSNHSDSDPASAANSAPVSRKSSGTGRARDVSGSRRRTSVAVRRAYLANHARTESPRAGRSVSGSSQHPESGASSRSTSRSRSPLPPPRGTGSPVLAAQGTTTQPVSSEVSTVAPEEEAFYSSAFVHSLQDLSSIATEIIDTPIGVLTAKPHACAAVIRRIQKRGKMWDEHPEWTSRGWYVRILLSVAGLSRVLEWWDAEKGFWDFGPEDDVDSEEIRFVARGEDDDAREGEPSSSAIEAFALPPPRHAVSRSPRPKEVPLVPKDDVAEPPSPGRASTVSSKPSEERPAPLDQTFKTAIDLARTETVLAEVALEDAVILYLNSGWTKVTGLDPQEVIGLPMGDLIDKNPELFNQANRKLMEDVGNTVELLFTIKISVCQSEAGDEEPVTEDHFIPMTGKGMLMVDRVTGEPTHSMWVLRLAPRKSEEVSPVTDPDAGRSAHVRSLSDPVAPVFAPLPLSTEPLLCRICEHHVPAYYFERHNETCAETHRLESQVSEANERLAELRDVVKDLRAGLDRAPGTPNLEYGGRNLLHVSYVPSPLGPLNPARQAKAPSAQHLALRAGQTAALDLIDELIGTALEVSTPSASDDSPAHDVENLRLLSPNSEDKLVVIGQWSFATIEDSALALLAEDALTAARSKAGVVSRMRNTILYAERIRIEWEAKAQQAFITATKRLAEASPLLRQSPGDEIARPRSAPPEEEPEAPDGLPKRSASVQGLRPTSHPEPASIGSHAPVTPEISTVTSDLKGLGFFAAGNLQTPAVDASPLKSPPRSPRFPASGATSRRGSEPIAETPSAVPGNPLSPRIPSAVPGKAKTAASIKDFDMIKPISKGAFGQVWLAKKKTTGQYYAIKILKKQDMIAKNQIMNVKSERKILMNQSDSDFVVKLYYTFSSRDHLYLVMEYLNGGDCASLVKTLGELPEDWARNYIAEVVAGLEYLHSTGVIHRDLKPDNLLIDSHGHLKLTDFGLSKIGLLGRQATAPGHNKPVSLSSSAVHGHRDQSQDRRRAQGLGLPRQGTRGSSPESTGLSGTGSSYFYPHHRTASGPDASSESSSRASEVFPSAATRSGAQFTSFMSAFGSQAKNRSEDASRAFFGTPDYLAPETILGFEMGETVDWWALGVICFEFLHGYPPFNDESPDKVFENIVQHRLHFPEPDAISSDAMDFIEQLLTVDPTARLGYGGADEVKAHPFLAPIDWDRLFKDEPSFVPRLDDPEATDYFDPRGATELVFRDEDDTEEHGKTEAAPLHTSPRSKRIRDRSETAPAPPTVAADDFGTFNYKNLPVLERENEEVIRKLRGDSQTERASRHARHMSFAGPMRPLGPVSPAESASSGNSGARRPGLPHHASSSASQTASAAVSPGHSRRPSEHPSPTQTHNSGTVAGDDDRRHSFPPLPRPRARSASFSGAGPPQAGEAALPAVQRAMPNLGSGATDSGISSTTSSPRRPFKKLTSPPPKDSPSSATAALPALAGSPKTVLSSGERTVDCLIAEDNPISSKILETILVRLGCRCVVVPNGAEAISCAMGDITFDVIFLDLLMPIIEGQDAARMIKSTQNPNMRTPIVAVTSFESYVSEEGTLFAAVLAKPVIKADLLAIFRRLGFVAKQKQPSRTERGSLGSGNGGSISGPSGGPGKQERKDSVELLKAELPPSTSSATTAPGTGLPKKGPLAQLSGGSHGRERRGTGASTSTDSSSGIGGALSRQGSLAVSHGTGSGSSAGPPPRSSQSGSQPSL